MPLPLNLKIELDLISTDKSVRAAAAKRTDFKATANQIARGLKDPFWVVRHAFISRADFFPTSWQIEQARQDKEPEVRMAFAKCHNLLLTTEQMDCGLSDKVLKVRTAFAERKDFFPTPEQMQQGLSDKNGLGDIFKRRQLEWASRREREILKEKFEIVQEDLHNQQATAKKQKRVL